MRLNRMVKIDTIYGVTKEYEKEISCLLIKETTKTVIKLKTLDKKVKAEIEIARDEIKTKLDINGTATGGVIGIDDLVFGDVSEYNVNRAVKHILVKIINDMLYMQKYYTKYEDVKKCLENRLAFAPMYLDRTTYSVRYSCNKNCAKEDTSVYTRVFESSPEPIQGVELKGKKAKGVMTAKRREMEFGESVYSGDDTNTHTTKQRTDEEINKEKEPIDFANIIKIINELNKFAANDKFAKNRIKVFKNIRVTTTEITFYQLLKMFIKELIKINKKVEMMIISANTDVVCSILRQPKYTLNNTLIEGSEIISVDLRYRLFNMEYLKDRKKIEDELQDYLNDLEQVDLKLD